MASKQELIQQELNRVYGGGDRLVINIAPAQFNEQQCVYFTGDLVEHIGQTSRDHLRPDREQFPTPRAYVKVGSLTLRSTVSDWLAYAAGLVDQNEIAARRKMLAAEHDQPGTHTQPVSDCPGCEAFQSSVEDDAHRARWQVARFEEKVGDVLRTLELLTRDINAELADFREDPRGVHSPEYRERLSAVRSAGNIANLVTQAVSNMRMGDLLNASVLADNVGKEHGEAIK